MTTFFERISPCSIIKNHFGTYRNARSRKYDYIEACLVVCVPLLPAYFVHRWSVVITDGVASSLFNMFAIMGGFLVNALVLLATRKGEEIRNKSKPLTPAQTNSVATRIELLEETSHNTSFGILVCLLAILVCVASGIVPNKEIFSSEKLDICIKVKDLFVSMIFYLLTLFVIILMMVTKRVNHLFCED